MCRCDFPAFFGSTENARSEYDGQVARHEHAGRENAGPKNGGLK